MSKKSRIFSIIVVLVLAISLLTSCVDLLLPSNSASTSYVELYAINDFHGTTDRMSTTAGYLTHKKNENENTIILSSGDMFQGSMQSNANYGNLLSDCMDDVGFDAFTIGNHEFDWGLDKLESLSQQSATPFLGANIYHWDADTKTWGTFADELAQEYVVKTLSNGIKVGIIGIIGKNQISSISSNLVQTIGFKDPAEIVPELSQKLRNELGCDVIVVSAHAGQSDFLDNNDFDITKYADVVFCGHTHQAEMTEKNGVPFVQGGAYGENISHVQLKISSSKKVTCVKYENIAYSEQWPNKYSVQELIDNSNMEIDTEANQVLGYISNGYLNKNTAVPRLVCNAIADYATSQGYDITLAMTNVGRNYLPSGAITYSDLYEAIPFDNVVYIVKVSGKDLLKEANYCLIWRVSEEAIESNKYYTIAVIDYILFHQNSSRNYDYLPSAFTSGFTPVALTKENVEVYNYRLITRDFLLSIANIDASVYSETNLHTDTTKLTTSVTF